MSSSLSSTVPSRRAPPPPPPPPPSACSGTSHPSRTLSTVTRMTSPAHQQAAMAASLAASSASPVPSAVKTVMVLDRGASSSSSSSVDFTENQASLLRTIRSVRKDTSLCDVEFLVGKSADCRRSFVANSTILALRSSYFKRLFFEATSDDTTDNSASEPKSLPKENTKKGIVIQDLEPEVFQKMLDFVEGSSGGGSGASVGPEDENANVLQQNGGFALRTNRHAWEVRYAAKKYGVADLVNFCDRHLISKLSYRNALDFLSCAANNGADDFKTRIFRIMRHRGHAVLDLARPVQIRELQLDDVVAILKLFSYVKADRLINFVQAWGSDMDHDAFREIFRDSFYPCINWETTSRSCMQQIHDSGLLDLQRENEALLRLLWSGERGENGEEEQKEDKRDHLGLAASLTVRIKHRTFDFKKSVCITRLVVKLASGQHGPSYPRGTVASQDNFFALDSGVYRIYQQLDKVAPCNKDALAVDPGDVQVVFGAGVGGEMSGNRQMARDVVVKAYYDALEDAVLMMVAFHPVPVSFSGSGAVGPGRVGTVSVEVVVARELLEDAKAGNLQVLPPLPASPPRSASTLRSLRAEVLSWDSGCEKAGKSPAAEAQQQDKPATALAFVAAVGFK